MKNKNHPIKLIQVMAFIVSYFNVVMAQAPLGTEFTYQGQLIDSGNVAQGAYDFEFTLFDDATGGVIIDAAYSMDAVAVENGLFTVELDFGDEAFLGNQLFLEIAVRPTGSGLPYELLSPRQKITAVPYAQHAQFVGVDAIGTEQIFDGSVLGADIANGSISSDQVDANSIQLRITQTCPVSQKIIGINNNGSVQCADDALGLVEVSGEDIIDGSISGIDMAAGSIGQAEINTAEVQQRITGSCPTGKFLTSINNDGSVQCEDDQTGLSAPITSAEILNETIIAEDVNADQIQLRITGRCPKGLQLVGIHANGELVCDFSSSKFQVNLNILQANIQASFNSDMALRSDGRPLLVYGRDELKLVDCLDKVCSAFNISTIDTGTFAQYKMLVRDDDRPLITYNEFDDSVAQLLNCLDVSCSTNTKINFHTADALGVDMALRENGHLVISYIDPFLNTLKIYNCENSECSSGLARSLDNTIVAQSNPADTAIAFDSSGLPRVAYNDSGNKLMKLYFCETLNCSTGSNIVIEGNGTDIIGSSLGLVNFTNEFLEFVIVAYQAFDLAGDRGVLRYARCDIDGCNIQSLDGVGADQTGYNIDMGINQQDQPVIIHRSSDDELRITYCNSINCFRSYTTKLTDRLATSATNRLLFRSDGSPIIHFIRDDALPRPDLSLFFCVDRDCS